MRLSQSSEGRIFCKHLIRRGGRLRAHNLVGASLRYLYEYQPKKATYIFFHALQQTEPMAQGKTFPGRRKKQAKIRWISFPLWKKRRQYLSLHWILRTTSKGPLSKNLGPSLYKASQSAGEASLLKKAYHQQSLEGRPYANYRWY